MTKLGFRADFDPNNVIVKQQNINVAGINLRVSTVDLGINHAYGDVALYYETMIFSADIDIEYQVRYATRKEAAAAHEELVSDLMSGKRNIKSFID